MTRHLNLLLSLTSEQEHVWMSISITPFIQFLRQRVRPWGKDVLHVLESQRTQSYNIVNLVDGLEGGL